MKKQEATNTMGDGLIMDLNPLSMPNTALSNCLNGTLLTYNGNENMLQNDMGNARVETAMLPAGYIPLGSTSFGGIIYIVSYNPIDKKYLIGSFPSPERNLTKDELNDPTKALINLNKFCNEAGWQTGLKKSKDTEDTEDTKYSKDTIITNYYLKVNLTSFKINPGDKYKVFSSDLNKNVYTVPDSESEKSLPVLDITSSYENEKLDPELDPKYIKFDIVSTLDNGKTLSLTNNSVWTEKDNKLFYIYPGDIKWNLNGNENENENGNKNLDLDEYRQLVGSNYDTYVSKLSGQLSIVAKLEVPTSFTVGYDILLGKLSSAKLLSDELPTDELSKDETINSSYDYYDLYFYINWANDNIKDKCRVNPLGVEYYLKEENGDNIIETVPITLPYINKDGVITDLLPDSLNKIDYLAFKVPEKFYDADFDIYDYLTESRNKHSNEKRKNDGTDFLYVIKGPTIGKVGNKYYIVKKGSDNNVLIPLENNHILNLYLRPYMPFGKLDFLKQLVTIDINKVQKGILNVYNYQYYVEDNNINLDFYVESYPELGKRITLLDVNLYPFIDNILQIKTKTNDEENTIVDEESKGDTIADKEESEVEEESEGNNEESKGDTLVVDKESKENNEEYEVDEGSKWLKQESYVQEQFSPFLTNPIPVSQVLLGNISGQLSIKIDRSDLQENKIYIIEFKFKYSDNNYRYFYRLLFNNSLFNNAYGNVTDFNELNLYDPDKNYGIKINSELSLIADPVNNVVNVEKTGNTEISNRKNFEKFIEDTRRTKEISHLYLISHNADTEFILNTGLDNELSLEIDSWPWDNKEENNLENKEENKEENLNVYATANYAILSDSEVILEKNNSVIPIIFSNGKFEIDNNFYIKIPYTVEYFDSKILDIYSPTYLKKSALKIRLLHWSKIEKQGHFAMVPEDSTTGEKDAMELYYSPDKSKNLLFSTSAIEERLTKSLDDAEADYITLLFGIYSIADDNCGYGYEQMSGNTNVGTYFKLKKLPKYAFILINGIRTKDGFVLIHSADNNLIILKPSNEHVDDTKPIYDQILKFTTAKYTIIKESYSKYRNTDGSKALYYVSAIKNPANPTIKVSYTYNLKADLQVKIKKDNHKYTIPLTITIEDDPDKNNLLANNLKLILGSSIKGDLTLETIINDGKWINELLTLDTDRLGWNSQNNSVISIEDTHKVYTDNTMTTPVTYLALNEDNKLILDSEKYTILRWIFAWEDLGNTNESITDIERLLNKNTFFDAKQRYYLSYTYLLNERHK